MANANHTAVVEKWERQRIRHVHRHKPVININKLMPRTDYGQRIADGLAAVMGSWAFIIISRFILAFWITLRSDRIHRTLDLPTRSSCSTSREFQAAYAAPIIMMSQNRQARRTG